MVTASFEAESEHEEEVEQQNVDRATRLNARLIYEVVRRDGQDELTRSPNSLIWSGLAAGILISFSILGEAVLRKHITDMQARPLIESLGYSLGFLLVVLGRMQLFTENTITTVLPLMAKPCKDHLFLMLRLWAIVLTSNVVGAFIAAGFIAHSGAFDGDLLTNFAEISEAALSHEGWKAFVKAIPAGVLVAAIVWMMPTAPHNPFFIILTFTWLIAAGDFTHIIAGSVEMAYLILTDAMGTWDAVFGFFLPVLAGNVVGGTVVFTLITWGQVRDEVKATRGELVRSPMGQPVERVGPRSQKT
ncbi:Formate/nitrite transporter FocA, FNT family [Tranquillimonas rosea]|uniref:Formate/nitrite transporter FocA, FNT family n=1 Tax=Tranquillimonas rosea TaxID=641238 RepID=A0A1H9U915_9RHOB|nr:formate/nitrite transporter family protein [Tranquillimonas rosea]SES05956.1 Formate/nitrite transporter FocA, FNT family [Tranquillimonas rosea]